jgi:uncharacterized protein YigE (DUF2233 family)
MVDKFRSALPEAVMVTNSGPALIADAYMHSRYFPNGVTLEHRIQEGVE